MNTIDKTRKFDLEDRTFQFAGDVRKVIKAISKNVVYTGDRDQLARSSGSVAANYVEANEAISTKDFSMRIRICRKEAKESHMWLRLLKDQVGEHFPAEIDRLIDESIQLVKIFNAIACKLKSN